MTDETKDMSAPAGWKLVPIKHDPHITQSVLSAHLGVGNYWSACYSAILASVPPPPPGVWMPETLSDEQTSEVADGAYRAGFVNAVAVGYLWRLFKSAVHGTADVSSITEELRDPAAYYATTKPVKEMPRDFAAAYAETEPHRVKDYVEKYGPDVSDLMWVASITRTDIVLTDKGMWHLARAANSAEAKMFAAAHNQAVRDAYERGRKSVTQAPVEVEGNPAAPSPLQDCERLLREVADEYVSWKKRPFGFFTSNSALYEHILDYFGIKLETKADDKAPASVNKRFENMTDAELRENYAYWALKAMRSVVPGAAISFARSSCERIIAQLKRRGLV